MEGDKQPRCFKNVIHWSIETLPCAEISYNFVLQALKNSIPKVLNRIQSTLVMDPNLIWSNPPATWWEIGALYKLTTPTLACLPVVVSWQAEALNDEIPAEQSWVATPKAQAATMLCNNQADPATIRHLQQQTPKWPWRVPDVTMHVPFTTILLLLPDHVRAVTSCVSKLFGVGHSMYNDAIRHEKLSILQKALPKQPPWGSEITMCPWTTTSLWSPTPMPKPTGTTSGRKSVRWKGQSVVFHGNATPIAQTTHASKERISRMWPSSFSTWGPARLHVARPKKVHNWYRLRVDETKCVAMSNGTSSSSSAAECSNSNDVTSLTELTNEYSPPPDEAVWTRPNVRGSYYDDLRLIRTSNKRTRWGSHP